MKKILTKNHPGQRLHQSSMLSIKGMLALFLCAFVFASCDRFEDDIDDIVDEVENREIMMFEAHLNELNNSGVTGTAHIKYSKSGNFEVMIDAKNLVANKVHAQHIHGFAPDGDQRNQDAMCPTMDAAGEDGLLTLQEGLPFYGPVLVPLDDYLVPLSSDNFPYANQGGNLSYHEMVATDALVSAFNAVYEGTQTEADLMLISRVIVLHGAYVKDGMVQQRYSEGAEYDASLPVACGEIMKM